jgi:hypothetical protein
MCCRIEEYLPKHKVAMEINKFENTNAIPLEQLKKDVEKLLYLRCIILLKILNYFHIWKKILVPDGTVVTHTYEI